MLLVEDHVVVLQSVQQMYLHFLTISTLAEQVEKRAMRLEPLE